jgi:hypothetical protein
MIGPDGTLVDYNGFNGYPAQRTGRRGSLTANENDLMFLAYRVTIGPVPEPSTYALMLAGLIGIGLITRRHRK